MVGTLPGKAWRYKKRWNIKSLKSPGEIIEGLDTQKKSINLQGYSCSRQIKKKAKMSKMTRFLLVAIVTVLIALLLMAFSATNGEEGRPARYRTFSIERELTGDIQADLQQYRQDLESIGYT